MSLPTESIAQLKLDALSKMTLILQKVRNKHFSDARQEIDQLEAMLEYFDEEFSERQRQVINKLRNIYFLDISRKEPEVIDDLDNDLLTLKKIDVGEPKMGISLVTACMNREANLLNVLDTWLATNADEIIIVDWSSTRELATLLSSYTDSRIKIIRIENEHNWILTYAFNVGMRFASHRLVVKLDCDIKLTPDFLLNMVPGKGEFMRGFWKAALEAGGEGQQYINGTFIVHKEDLREVNYFNESIVTYGWDDSDLYYRLTHDLGLSARQIDPKLISHIDQLEEQRLENQNVVLSKFMGIFEPTEFEGAKNKYYSNMSIGWGKYMLIQDYILTQFDDFYYRGYRTTNGYERNTEIDVIAEELASAQLIGWGKEFFSECGLSDVDINFGLAKLMSKLHSFKLSAKFIEFLKKRQKIQFIHCEDSICNVALQKTIPILRLHYPVFADSIIIVQDTVSFLNKDWIEANQDVFFVDKDVFSKLINATKAKVINNITSFSESLLIGNLLCHHFTISISNLTFEVIENLKIIQANLSDTYEVPNTYIPKTAMVTSLFDEGNLLRLVEYIACVVANIAVFERTVICYESSNGLLAAIVNDIVEVLKIPPGHILFVPYRKRPVFEELFSLGNIFPVGTVIAVANADVAFDASFMKLMTIDFNKTIVVLSRRDISEDGKHAQLIRLSNGYPNTFSADAWIFSIPFEADFFLDYCIGSFHCDSFINNQISRSERYTVVNPCLDVNIFHLHDERFNSSAEKQRRDIKNIQESYGVERERNGGCDPIKGVLWSTAATAHLLTKQLQFQTWSPKCVCIILNECEEINFGHLILLHAYNKLIMHNSSLINDVSLQIQLSLTSIKGVVGNFLSKYLVYFSYANITLDVFDSVDIDYTKMNNTFVRNVNFTDLADVFMKGDFDFVYDFLAWPNVPDVELLRCEIDGDISTKKIVELLNNQIIKETILPDIFDFYESLLNFSEEKKLITPFVVPYIKQVLSPQEIDSDIILTTPKVTFITSLFRGGIFLKGYLENVLAAANQADGEVIIIDVNPDNDEQEIIAQFIDCNPDARDRFSYFHLDYDPGLYKCWQLAISKARAEFITNANIDDRRCPSHTLRLVNLMAQNPQIAGACGSITCVRSDGEAGWFSMDENEVWFYGEGAKALGFEDLYRFNDKGEILSRNIMHCMPVWRKSLHEDYGEFDEETYGTSADWAFWLKCAKAGEKFLLDENAFGRYYLNPDSHNRRNDSLGLKESCIIRDFIGYDQSTITKQ